MSSVKVSVVFYSGYGHTAKVANHVANGARKFKGAEVHLIDLNLLDDAGWATIDSSDAIIFGAPTYMGSIASKMKEFIEKASGRWAKQEWKDKIAAGFTNSMGLSGDKLNSLFQLYVNAMQHGMIWVGFAQLSSPKTGIEYPDQTSLNRLGSWSGLMTQSNNDKAEVTPPSGDLDSAEVFGERVAKVAATFNAGRVA
jgi:NAD(P)H dehydrogenase (quinone)